MIRTTLLGMLLGASLLAACGARAPLAPIGLDRRPANSPDAIATLTASGEHTPDLSDQGTDVQPPATFAKTVAPPAVRAPLILSDYSAPAGLDSLSVADRAQLLTAARSAQSVVIRCRGDRFTRSQISWNEMVRRGARVKVFLVRNGVDPQRVRLLVRSTGGFVADNTTAIGKAKNRRVEIHFG